MINIPDIHGIVMNAFAAGKAYGKAEESPDKDYISERAAFAIFGRAWIRRKIEDGSISVHRSGDAKNSKKYISMAECRIAKYAETIEEIIYKSY